MTDCHTPQNLMGDINAGSAERKRQRGGHNGTHHGDQPAVSFNSANDAHHAVSGILANHNLINVKLGNTEQIDIRHDITSDVTPRGHRFGENGAIPQGATSAIPSNLCKSCTDVTLQPHHLRWIALGLNAALWAIFLFAMWVI